MLRGSAVLLRRSIKHYAPLIEVIASVNPTVWEIDAHAYTDESIQLLSEAASVTVQDPAGTGSQGWPSNSWRSTASGFIPCLRAVER